MIELTTGSCLCGAVEFQVSGNFESFFFCHCARCRKDTGSAHSANLFSSTATIAWLSGQGKIKTFKVPETQHEKSFCTECGAALPTAQAKGAGLVVPAGSVDSRIGVRPSAHICFASRAQWDEHLERVEKVDGLPG